MRELRFYAPKSPVIVVGTHLDSLRDKKNQKQIIAEGLEQIKVYFLRFEMCFPDSFSCLGHPQVVFAYDCKFPEMFGQAFRGFCRCACGASQ
jgi:hypothetical protein